MWARALARGRWRSEEQTGDVLAIPPPRRPRTFFWRRRSIAAAETRRHAPSSSRRRSAAETRRAVEVVEEVLARAAARVRLEAGTPLLLRGGGVAELGAQQPPRLSELFRDQWILERARSVLARRAAAAVSRVFSRPDDPHAARQQSELPGRAAAVRTTCARGSRPARAGPGSRRRRRA